MIVDTGEIASRTFIDLHMFGRDSARAGNSVSNQKSRLIQLKDLLTEISSAARRAVDMGNESAGRQLGRECVAVFTRFGINAALPTATRLSWNYSVDWMTECESLVGLCKKISEEADQLLLSM